MRQIVFSILIVCGTSCAASSAYAADAASPGLIDPPTDHPLHELLTIASQRELEVREKVKDYSCMIVKRERINDRLQEYRFIEAKVRASRMRNGEPLPLAVHLRFRRPAQVAGRQILFVEGMNDGKMVIRRGGERLSYVTVKVDPDSELARTETLMRITDLGFDSMISQIVDQIRKDIVADPSGDNTRLKVSRKAKINERPCTAVQITHPRSAPGLLYHRAEFYVDNEFHLPARIAAFDWPEAEGDDPKLMAEFIYTNIKINLGLTEADFDPALLQTASR